MAAGNVRGSKWGRAVDYAKQGKYGKAKQQVELGGGTWSTDMHKSLKATGNYIPPTTNTPPTEETTSPEDEVADLKNEVADLVEAMKQQQIDQQNAYNRQQEQLAAERERMRPKDASKALNSTILSGGNYYNTLKKKNWLQPFSSLMPGGN